jgi:PGF-CTERM protein
MGALDFTDTWQTVTAPAGYPELQAGPPPAAERGPDIEDTDSDGDGGDGFGPGFGPGVVLAGLSGAGYLLKRRGTTNDTDGK